MSKDNLSWDDLEVIYSSLPPKGVIGIVCRPDCVEAIRKVASLYEKPDPFNPPSLFCGVPIYDKVGQIEPWRAFYDEVELREYLES